VQIVNREINYYITGDSVKPSFLSRLFPSLFFYMRTLRPVLHGSYCGWRNRYPDEVWIKDSLNVLRAIESVGARVEVTGAENLAALRGPCVFVSNHMSTLETFTLPSMILPFTSVTFVLKKSLLEYPIFRHLLLSLDPIEVGRVNPREDLKAVLEGGTRRLEAGVSIIVFPQTTRSYDFNPKEFNTIGVKLAARAGVPVVPVALRTDAWGQGRFLKDFGRVDPSRPVRFSFGEPISVAGRGVEEHAKVVEFIQGRLKEWAEAP